MRSVRSILALYIIVWFHVVVPMHTRGFVTVPGTTACGDCSPSAGRVSDVASCCHDSGSGGSSSSRESSDGRRTPTREQRQRCAICFVASMYFVQPVFTIDLDPAEHVAMLNEFADAQVRSLEFPTPFWPTGPPAALTA